VRAIPNALRPLAAQPAVDAAPGPQIVAVGRLQREKGHDLLIEAFAAVAHDFPKWRLTILGEGPERDALAALARARGIGERVSLPGWTDRPEDVLAGAELFVMASRYEGFPNALLEAMGVGLPVISTACGGAEELIENGTSGRVVKLDDPPALAAALRELMADPTLRRRFGAAAQRAAHRYTPAAVFRLWDEILRLPCPAKRDDAKSCSSSAR
jgi:glycosyltransferase involved in cell wall biosynthesis